MNSIPFFVRRFCVIGCLLSLLAYGLFVVVWMYSYNQELLSLFSLYKWFVVWAILASTIIIAGRSLFYVPSIRFVSFLSGVYLVFLATYFFVHTVLVFPPLIQSVMCVISILLYCLLLTSYKTSRFMVSVCLFVQAVLLVFFLLPSYTKEVQQQTLFSQMPYTILGWSPDWTITIKTLTQSYTVTPHTRQQTLVLSDPITAVRYAHQRNDASPTTIVFPHGEWIRMWSQSVLFFSWSNVVSSEWVFALMTVWSWTLAIWDVSCVTYCAYGNVLWDTTVFRLEEVRTLYKQLIQKTSTDLFGREWTGRRSIEQLLAWKMKVSWYVFEEDAVWLQNFELYRSLVYDQTWIDTVPDSSFSWLSLDLWIKKLEFIDIFWLGL